MSGSADPLLSRAILIGTSHYQSLTEIGAVHNNLAALAEVLRADRFWGLPAERCVVVEDPGTAADMLDPVAAAASDATDTLLLYYTGHGLVGARRGDLHLALTGSDPQRIYTAVSYGLMRDVLLDSRAARRIVILDCCYSGRALGQMADLASAVVDEASAEGTYVMAASAENKTALAPPGETYTAFTGELLAIMRNGISQCGPVLDLDSVYQHLLAAMKSKGFPIPQKRDRNTAGQLTLIRNQAYRLPPRAVRWDELSRPGQTLRTQAGTMVTVGNRLGEGSQGGIYQARVGDTWLAVKWIRPGPGSDKIRQSITELIRRGRPSHPAFVWPLDLVSSDRVPGFGYTMPLLEHRFTPLMSMLAGQTPPSFRATAAIGRELAGAFQALHRSGLCFQDVAGAHVLADQEACEVAITGAHSFGVDGQQTQIFGSALFLAPELLRGEAFPSATSDLHSLAVILFYLLMHGHPLFGIRTDPVYGPESATYTPKGQTDIFGVHPLFIFDPDDRSNRPLPDEIVSAWWPVYPQYIRDLFTRAFTTGLHDASLHGRVLEGVWRRALLSLHDCVSTCANCGASVCYDLDQPGQRCWHCSKILPPPATLKVPGGTLVLSEGAIVSSHHLYKDRDYRSACATIEQHPEQPGSVVLRNLTDTTWTVVPEGKEPNQAGPGQYLPVRPMQINFGKVQGRIVYSEFTGS